ncbi:hypothetical protein EIN_307680, partial [Entamoeba invadens IP1]
FDCCGWVTKRPMPPCASSIGATTGLTCKVATKHIEGASLQNTIIGYAFFVALSLGVVLIYLVGANLNKSGKGYDKLSQ